MSEKLKFAFYWGASCGGCEVAVLDINEKILDVAAAADILLWPVAFDGKYKDIEALPDRTIDVCFFNGGVRNSETEHIAKLLRAKSKAVVAFGACAMTGGVPGLANQYSRSSLLDRIYGTVESNDAGGARPQTETSVPEGTIELPTVYSRVYPLHEIIPVDYSLPGCPPTVEWIGKALDAILTGDLPPAGTIIGEAKTLCDECPRERTGKKGIKKFHRPHEIISEPGKCLLEQGIICCGPATRSGCRAACPGVNMPCRGCYGAPPGVTDQGAKMLSAAASLIDSDDEKEIETIVADVRDTIGTFYQFGLPGSLLRESFKKDPI